MGRRTVEGNGQRLFKEEEKVCRGAAEGPEFSLYLPARDARLREESTMYRVVERGGGASLDVE